MPNRENIRKWVDALRSGEYRQGYGRLRSDGSNAYCCLGVACDVSGVGRWTGSLYETDGEMPWGVSGLELPNPVVRWLGLDDRDPYMESAGGDSLSSLNDSENWDFDKIADLLESEYLG